MATTVQKAAPPARAIVLYNVTWREYIRLGRILGDRPLRMTFDRGTLELRMPSSQHERWKCLLRRLVEALSEELNIAIASYGSMTCRRRKKQKAFEPDECYWIANEAAVRGKDHINFRVDPPPDLGIEIDITKSSLDRMGIYAALGVSEVWRYGKKGLTFNSLQPDGKYVVFASSLAFPGLTPADLMTFLAMRDQQDENSIVKAFRAFVRQRFGKGPTP